MGRLYRIPISTTLTNAGGDADLLTILPATNKPCELVGYKLSQASENGDAQEEQLDLSIVHMTGTVTNGSGGAAVTPVANRPGTNEVVAAGFTARANDTTLATTSGTSTVMEPFGWNERNTPYDVWIPEEMRPKAINGEALILRNNGTVADDVNVRGVVYVMEH